MFYSFPRFVTHIDDNAIQSLTDYYAQVTPQTRFHIVQHIQPVLLGVSKGRWGQRGTARHLQFMDQSLPKGLHSRPHIRCLTRGYHLFTLLAIIAAFFGLATRLHTQQYNNNHIVMPTMMLPQ